MSGTGKTGRSLHIFLTCLCIAFVLITILDMNRNYELVIVEPSEELNVKASEYTVAKTEVVSIKPVSDYDQIIERPLFMPNRRPYTADGIVESRQNNGRKNLVTKSTQHEYMLSAVVITENRRIALLYSKKDNKLQKLNQGDELDGWTLIDIQPSQVSLKKGAAIKQLELTVKRSPQQPNARHEKNNQAPVIPKATLPLPAAMVEKISPELKAPSEAEN